MRITVFCSAIVIVVIVHCHTAGALLSQTAENNCPYHRVVGFLILSGQFIITMELVSRERTGHTPSTMGSDVFEALGAT